MKAILINPFGVLFNLPSNETVRIKCFTEINYCKTVLGNPDQFTVIDGAIEFEKTVKGLGFKIVNITNAYNRDIVKNILQSRGLSYSYVYSIHDNFHRVVSDIKEYLEINDNDIVIISKRREDIDYAKLHGIRYIDMCLHNLQEASDVLNSIL